MLEAILNKSWQQHPHKAPTIRPPASHHENYPTRRTRHVGHCWRSKDELISDILLWTPTYGQAEAGRPARTYILQLCEDTGCSPEDLSEAMNDREKWRERVRDIRASGTRWWLLPGPLWTEAVVPIGVLSMGKTNLFKNYSYLIGLHAKKKCLRSNHTKM